MQKIISSGHIEIVVTLRRTFDTHSGSAESVVRYGFNWLS